MFLGKKKRIRVYDEYNDYHYENESNLRYISKHVLALGATSSLAYLSFKYGLPEVSSMFSSTFSFSPDVSEFVQDKTLHNFAVLGVSAFGGAFVGLFSEMFADMNFRNYRSNGGVFLKVFLAIPLAASAYYLHSSPQAMDILLETGKHILSGGATLAGGVLSAATLASPLFFGSIAKYVDNKLDTLPAFSRLTQKFTDSIASFKKQRAHKKDIQTLEKSDEKNANQYEEKELKTVLYSQFNSIKNTINEAMSRHGIERENTNLSRQVKNSLDTLSNHSLFILDNMTIDNLEAKQEVMSLINSTLPQLALSFYKSLNNQDKATIENNTNKLFNVLQTTNEHFTEIVEGIKKKQANLNNMDFEQAIEFTKARFSKKIDENLESENTKKMKMGG